MRRFAERVFAVRRPMVDIGNNDQRPRIRKATRMTTLTIQCHFSSATACALCGKTTAPGSGPRLFLGDSDEAVCRDCGKRLAPDLTALLDLAAVAERVGRIGRHTLVPPMAALLDLARAAEQYTDRKPQTMRQAA
jgi:hypothetical protein